jgi:uncharacterized protein YccT (UPF0319 family)
MKIKQIYYWPLACLLLGGGCAATSTYRLADASIPPEQIVSVWIPVMLDPLTIDRRPAARDLIPTGERYRYELAPGAHEIAVRYSGFTDVPEEIDIVRSLPVTVAFNGLPGHHYRLEYDAHANAIRFGQGEIRPNVSVTDITTNKALIDSWTKHASRPPPPPKTGSQPTPVTSTNLSVGPVAESGISARLRQGWQQAGETERGAFLQWIVTAGNPPLAPAGALRQLQETWRQAGDAERGEFLKWASRLKPSEP